MLEANRSYSTSSYVELTRARLQVSCARYLEAWPWETALHVVLGDHTRCQRLERRVTLIIVKLHSENFFRIKPVKAARYHVSMTT